MSEHTAGEMTLRGLVDAVMHSPVVTIGPDESLRAAATALRDAHIGTLAVLDDTTVLGSLSERDVVRALADGADPDRATVGTAMRAQPRYLTSGESVGAAVEVMLAAGIRHLPVLEEGELVGMLSMRDLVRALRHASGPH